MWLVQLLRGVISAPAVHLVLETVPKKSKIVATLIMMTMLVMVLPADGVALRPRMTETKWQLGGVALRPG